MRSHFVRLLCALFMAGVLAVPVSSAGAAGGVYHPPAQGSGPYSEAVQVGNMLYLAGKLGTVPGKRELAPGGIQGETRQVLENIKAVLERHGSSMEQVVKCTVFLADIDEWPAMNKVYATYFPTNRPARSAVEVSGLVLGARLEIECMATVD